MDILWPGYDATCYKTLVQKAEADSPSPLHISSHVFITLLFYCKSFQYDVIIATFCFIFLLFVLTMYIINKTVQFQRFYFP